MGGENFNLRRFQDAQDGRDGMVTIYERALEELKAGRKQSHWMWFVFPQLAGLGESYMAKKFAIQSLDEARAYLAHPILGDTMAEVDGVHARVVSLASLIEDKSGPRHDPAATAKDQADVALLTALPQSH